MNGVNHTSHVVPGLSRWPKTYLVITNQVCEMRKEPVGKNLGKQVEVGIQEGYGTIAPTTRRVFPFHVNYSDVGPERINRHDPILFDGIKKR